MILFAFYMTSASCSSISMSRFCADSSESSEFDRLMDLLDYLVIFDCFDLLVKEGDVPFGLDFGLGLYCFDLDTFLLMLGSLGS